MAPDCSAACLHFWPMSFALDFSFRNGCGTGTVEPFTTAHFFAPRANRFRYAATSIFRALIVKSELWNTRIGWPSVRRWQYDFTTSDLHFSDLVDPRAIDLDTKMRPNVAHSSCPPGTKYQKVIKVKTEK